MQGIERRLILGSEMNEADVICLGDFIIWDDDIKNNDVQNFLIFLNNFSHVKLVNKPTYNSGYRKKIITPM